MNPKCRAPSNGTMRASAAAVAARLVAAALTPRRDHVPGLAHQHVKAVFQKSQLRAESVSIAMRTVHYNSFQKVDTSRRPDYPRDQRNHVVDQCVASSPSCSTTAADTIKLQVTTIAMKALCHTSSVVPAHEVECLKLFAP
ncbi:hypothetical protein [Anatilimnocola floriformis]|uniref:hypothetical protein n=1 Tax=Anatilimnocola floriformis TaxID=2948575 RepID=UPI0020C47994|nr:hypothetical protein [Anatilimnocola floriformis]